MRRLMTVEQRLEDRADSDIRILAAELIRRMRSGRAITIFRALHKKSELSSHDLIWLLGEQVASEIAIGEAIKLYACSGPDYGHLQVSLMRLPTDRWAAIVEYEGKAYGEYSKRRYRKFCSVVGVFSSPLVTVTAACPDPDCIPFSMELLDPTDEEQAFIEANMQLQDITA